MRPLWESILSYSYMNKALIKSSLYLFWTGKVEKGDGSIEWINGMCENEFPVDKYVLEYTSVSELKNIIREDFKKENDDKIRKIISEAGTIQNLYYNVVDGKEVENTKKYAITWSQCMRRVNAFTFYVFKLTLSGKLKSIYDKADKDRGVDIEKSFKDKIEAEKSNSNNTNLNIMDRFKDYKYLGYMNSPTFDYSKIKGLTDIQSIKIGRSEYIEYSEKKKIYWKVDSSD